MNAKTVAIFWCSNTWMVIKERSVTAWILNESLTEQFEYSKQNEVWKNTRCLLLTTTGAYVEGLPTIRLWNAPAATPTIATIGWWKKSSVRLKGYKCRVDIRVYRCVAFLHNNAQLNKKTIGCCHNFLSFYVYFEILLHLFQHFSTMKGIHAASYES